MVIIMSHPMKWGDILFLASLSVCMMSRCAVCMFDPGRFKFMVIVQGYTLYNPLPSSINLTTILTN